MIRMIGLLSCQNLLLKKRLLVFILFLCLSGCEQDNSENHHPPHTQVETQEKSTSVSNSSESTASQFIDNAPDDTDKPVQSVEDIVALANVMHGAVDQQPDDGPKDKYGKPYIIGNLGGFAVNLPSSVVKYVEYSDSPGWDMDAVRNYKPPVRNYDSVLNSFGFEIRIADGVLYDSSNPELRHESAQAGDTNVWFHVGISSGTRYGGNRDWLNDMLDENFNPTEAKTKHWYYSRRLPERQFGLEVYVNDEIDPKTGKPFRVGVYPDDLFVMKDANGQVEAYITCFNKEVPEPPCDHLFNFPPPMKLRATLRYSRKRLSQWRDIEQMAIDAIEGFRIEPIEPLSDITNPTIETQGLTQ